MKLSIIIVDYKSLGLVKNCVRGINSLCLPFDFEILVVDNNSMQNAEKELAEKYPTVKVITLDKNIGFAAGNNVGIKESRGEYIMMINSDIAILTDAVEKMVDYLKYNQDVGLIGPKLIFPNKQIQNSCYKFPSFMIPIYRRTALGRLKPFKKKIAEYLMQDFDHDHTREVDWMLGACFMFPRRVLDDVGLLDERYFMYFEDVDWCRRFKEKGYRVMYLSDAEMIHYHQRGSAHKLSLTKVHVISWLKYFLKYRRKQLS